MKMLPTLTALLLSVFIGSEAQAQAAKWPIQPIKIIVSFAPGGAADQLARIMAPHLSQALGQPVVVENKVGAGGNIGADQVAKSTPDGYTLLLGSGGIFSINPHLYKPMPFDPAKDLVPVSTVARVPQYLVVRSDSGITDFTKFVADLKANPGKRSYGTPGIGTSGHLASEMMLADVGAKAAHIPYKGGVPALADLLGGQLDFMFDSGAALQHVKCGKLRLVGVGSSARAPLLPEVPTLEELGLKGFNADTVFGLYAPAKAPQAVVTRINAAVNQILANGPAKDQILASGQIPLFQTLEQFSRGTAADYQRYGAAIRASSISAQ